MLLFHRQTFVLYYVLATYNQGLQLIRKETTNSFKPSLVVKTGLTQQCQDSEKQHKEMSNFVLVQDPNDVSTKVYRKFITSVYLICLLIVICILDFKHFPRLHSKTVVGGRIGDNEYNNSYVSLTDLFRINFNVRSHIQVFPSTINKYIHEVAKGNKDRTELMNHEWARFESFKTFPISSTASPMRLAQAGFYYSGDGEDVICFCCVLRNAIWHEDEPVLDVHRRLSPNCGFVTGMDTTNIPSHYAGDEHLNSERNRQSSSATDDLNYTSLSSSAAAAATAASKHTLVSHTYDQLREQSASNQQISSFNTISTLDDDETERENNDSVLPTAFQQPKYPDFALKCVRRSSFISWMYTNIVGPDLLADAGFFFAGLGDCVRCFFCGGGLKNWEAGDNPWVEHARWYPRCTYVIQCKGADSLSTYGFSSVVFTSGTANKSQPCVNKNNSNQEPFSVQYSSSNFVEDMASDAVKIVLELGYGQDTVVQGIRRYKNKYGLIPVRAHELVEAILENGFDKKLSGTLSNSQKSMNQQTKNQKTEKFAVSGTCMERSLTSETIQNSSASGTVLSQAPKQDYQSLIEENRILREQVMCKICMDRNASVVFLPCGHMVSCAECSSVLRKCAICRQIIRKTIRAFAS